MKQVIIVCVLLLVLVVFLVLNAIYINKVTIHMENAVDALPDITDPACVDAARALREDWLRHAPFLDLSVNFLLSDRICEQTALLISCAEVGDAFGYASARATLSDALEDMRRSERFSPVSLF